MGGREWIKFDPDNNKLAGPVENEFIQQLLRLNIRSVTQTSIERDYYDECVENKSPE